MESVSNTIRWLVGSLMLAGALSVGLIGMAFSAKSDGHDDSEWSSSSAMLLSADSRQYQEECSACHMAYPSQLLPARSWSAIMKTLDDHFGENAELMPETQMAITDLLTTNAADQGKSRLGRKAMQGLKSSQTPLRITELPFYTHEHGEVPDRYVTGNPDVGSFSQCQACHGLAAERGVFDEDTVKIPGVRRWDD